ncbi:hypothetical protein ACF0H5_019613 [Mactra antiquata]
MDTYMTILYVTLEQEIALKDFFMSKGWMYCKPDLNVITEKVGPFETPTVRLNNEKNRYTPHNLENSELSIKTTTTESEKLADKRYQSPPEVANGNNCSVVADVNNSSVVANGNSSPVVANGNNNPVVANGNNSPVVKVEVSCNIDEDYNDNNYDGNVDDDGDNDDDFADDVEACVVDNPIVPAYDTVAHSIHEVDVYNKDHTDNSSSVNSHDNNDSNMVAIVNIDVQTSTDTFQEKQTKNSTVFDKKFLMRELTRALKSSKSGKESSKTDFSVCHYCKRSVRNRSVRRHLLAHLNLPFKCGRCTLYFNTAVELERHKEEKHMGEFVCTYCGVKYRHKNSLNEHVQKQHEGTAKVFECEVCGVQMCRLRHLEDHMNIHRNVNPYTCSKCGKGYKNKCAYKRHNKTCGSKVKHACDQCGQLYSTVLGLRDHIKRCHEERHDFKCICGVDFKTRSARCRHRLKCDTYISSRTGPDFSKAKYENPVTDYSEVIDLSNNINTGEVNKRHEVSVTEQQPENEWSYGDQC